MATVYRGSTDYPPTALGPLVTIGNFDGVHRGHRALIRRTMARARERGVPSLVYTFEPAPRDVLRPDNDVPRIQCLDDRIASLEAVGVDAIVVEEFTKEFGARGPQWFAQHVLGERLRAAGVVLGWNFRFGTGRTGNVASLGGWLDVPVEAFGPWRVDGDVVSSSRIRMATRAGEVALASRLLGRPHIVRGTVVSGDQRGHQLGWPTANVRTRTALLPAEGVYAVQVDTGDGVLRGGIANLGTRPTFVSSGAPVLEVHLLDWEGDLYGRELRVHIAARIRDEQSFADVDALKERIALDARDARRRLGL